MMHQAIYCLSWQEIFAKDFWAIVMQKVSKEKSNYISTFVSHSAGPSSPCPAFFIAWSFGVWLCLPAPPPRGLFKHIPTSPTDISLWRNLVYNWGQVPGPTGSPLQRSPGASWEQERASKTKASEGKRSPLNPGFDGASSTRNGKSEISSCKMPEKAGRA